MIKVGTNIGIIAQMPTHPCSNHGSGSQ